VSESTHTSNACIHKWFGDSDITPSTLIQKPIEEKTRDMCCLAYQVPEKGATSCGRSFEDAFILANPNLFELTATPESDREAPAWDKAENIAKKSDFALKYAITTTGWVVPRYIKEGLLWLANGNRRATAVPSASTRESLAASEAPPAKK
jgi:hypothetical protein